MTEINTSLISTFQHSFPPSPLSSASSSPHSNISLHSRRHNSCNENLEFDGEISPLIPLNEANTLQISNQNTSHDLVQRRNSNTIEYRRGNKERISWKKSLSELSEKLGEICGSGSNVSIDCIPKSRTSVSSHSLSSSPMTNFKLCDRMGILKMSDSSSETLDHAEQMLSPDATEFRIRKPPMKRAESLFDSVSPHRNMVVRHMETNERLQNQLFQITKKSKTDERTGRNSFTDYNDASSSIANYHITSLQVQQLTLHQDTLLPSLENFKVEMVEKTKLLIRKTSIPDNILFQVSLDKPVDKNCLCFMDLDKKLSLHSYPPSIVNLDYGKGTRFYIPVVMSNPSGDGGYSISFHIPAEFRAEDMLVKTVDNLLTISCMHRRTSMGRVDQHLQRSYSNVSPTCHLTMDASLLLPASVNSRSVSASFTNHNQLIVHSLGML